MKRYCLALDLVDDPQKIEEYERWHAHPKFPTAIGEKICQSGIQNMELYRTGNRLFMIMETSDEFSFNKKAAMDENDPDTIEWEQLMWQFQQPLPWASPGQKWVLMNRIFKLD